MATRVRSYSKINLGLAIGPPRPDGFHALTTLYQTLALHEFVTVAAERAPVTTIRLESNDPRVPTDSRNTAWKMIESALQAAGVAARVRVFLDKRLPVQGGMGAGSANAAAALLGLERELHLGLTEARRLELAAAVGSDVPLFLVGGSVFGTDRGQVVRQASDVTLNGHDEIACLIALPGIGVSTPLAFREWDRRFAHSADRHLQDSSKCDTLEKLSRIYASVLQESLHRITSGDAGAAGIASDPDSRFAFVPNQAQAIQNNPENLQGAPHEKPHGSPVPQGAGNGSGTEDDLAGNALLALVQAEDGAGLQNDFETVVFPQHPLLAEIKRILVGSPDAGYTATYAALSGSGSTLFGLYPDRANAEAARQALEQHGVKALVTSTLPHARYWSDMFAE